MPPFPWLYVSPIVIGATGQRALHEVVVQAGRVVVLELRGGEAGLVEATEPRQRDDPHGVAFLVERATLVEARVLADDR